MPYTYKYPRPAVTADSVILKRDNTGQIEVLLIERKSPPFRGMWALPGGFLDMDETLEECVARETMEETRLEGISFHQVAAFSAPDRDPRHRTVTVAFYGWADAEQSPKASSDAKSLRWFPVDHLPELAFDHDLIIKKALERALEK